MATAQKPRKQNKTKGKWQTHIYLSPEDAKRLFEVATEQCRSSTSQLEYFVKRGLAAYDKGER